jgi:hypothetical protein
MMTMISYEDELKEKSHLANFEFAGGYIIMSGDSFIMVYYMILDRS